MSTSDLPGSFEIVIDPRSDAFDADDDRWQNQVATLYAELRDEVDTVRTGRPVEGTKGAIDEMIIALGSSGAFTATIECFRAWLKRDRGRRIDVRWDDNGTERFVTFTGDAVDSETVKTIASAAADRIGGQAWQHGTAHF